MSAASCSCMACCIFSATTKRSRQDDEAEAMEAREDELLRLLAAARGDHPVAIEVGPITRHTHD